jgi:hypothetical protein
VNGKVATYDDTNENVNIRAFGLSGDRASQKARYGIEFFYQPSRYVQALTSDTVTDAAGRLATNPIFAPDPSDPKATVRDHGLVFYAAITGVPWQLIARQDADGTPDLNGGVYVDPVTKMASTPGGFKSYEELTRKDKLGNTFWDDIVGDPESYVLPISPFMQESTGPRTGTDPITGIATTQPGAGTNPINGNEWSIPKPAGDIEYACIFPVVGQPINCKTADSCDCNGADSADNPLCAANPDDGGRPTLQTHAKAYPGIKSLAIAKGMESQGIAASICPAQLDTPNDPTTGEPRQDYGYRPAVNAIIDRLKQALTAECLPRQLVPDPKTGQVDCVVLEATDPMGKACDCTGTSRAKVSKLHLPAEAQAQQQLAELGMTADSCICEITPAKGADLTACTKQTNDTPTDPDGQPANGWCYIDAAEDPSVASLVRGCPSSEQRQIRFVGKAQPATNALTFITCEGQ